MDKARGKSSLIRTIETISKTKVVGQALTEVEKLFSYVDLQEEDIIKLYAISKNNLNKDTFTSTPFDKRILLLPQCLRDHECKASLDEWGYHCKECGKCSINGIQNKAEKLGYKVFVLPGGSIVEKVFKRFKPKAVLGVSCMKELILGILASERNNIVPYVLPLLKDGCTETEVDLVELRNTISLS